MRDRWRRLAALGAVAGPAAFVTAWAVGGAVTDGYDPVDTAISRLAADGAPTRTLMTAGFVTFAAGVGLSSTAIGRVSRPAGLAAAVTALATAGVAATPLDTGVDGAHGVAAAVGYASLAAVPLLAARSLRRRGTDVLAATGLVAGTVSALCLAGTVVADDVSGLLQRVGLTVTDAWLVAFGLALAAGRVATPEHPPAVSTST